MNHLIKLLTSKNKILAILCFFLSASGIAYAQTPDSLGYDTFYYQSPPRIKVEAEAVVRFATTADVYLKWSTMPGASNYMFRYKMGGAQANAWMATICTTNEKVLENVPLDNSIEWEVLVYNNTGTLLYESSRNTVFTTAQHEPIEVSGNMYNKLERWFSKELNPEGFCEFFNAINLNRYEKLAFLQAYSFNNESFVKPPNPNLSVLRDWYPIHTILGTSPDDDCIPVSGNCNCKVITKGSNIATPNEKMENFKVFPQIFKTSQRHRVEAGAAKFISLFQDRSGGQELSMSNVQGSGDNSGVTTEASEIAFFLGCLAPNGGFTTNLPEDCQCERPLHIYYEYETRLHVRSNIKSCPWSKGAEATAEDMAFVGVYHGKTGALTAIDAGQKMLSNSCSSTWNPQFWINVVNLLTPLAEYYLATLGDPNAVPTQQQLEEFINAIKVLITTNFSNHSGQCGTLEQDQVLVGGSTTLNLLPNSPIRVGLFSSYYVRTRGYGCWKAEAAVASDYYLLGVVESQLTENPECCVDKYANYIAGSQSSPAGSNYSVHAPNTVESEINTVGFLLSIFGSWDDFDPFPGSGIINLLEHQYENSLHGPSCFTNPIIEKDKAVDLLTAFDGKLSVYPSIATDFINMNVNMTEPVEAEVKLLDMKGGLSRTLFSGNLAKEAQTLQFPISDLPKGPYLVRCQFGEKNHAFKILIQ